jgi:hypothetical protein
MQVLQLYYPLLIYNFIDVHRTPTCFFTERIQVTQGDTRRLIKGNVGLFLYCKHIQNAQNTARISFSTILGSWYKIDKNSIIIT